MLSIDFSSISELFSCLFDNITSPCLLVKNIDGFSSKLELNYTEFSVFIFSIIDYLLFFALWAEFLSFIESAELFAWL